MSSLRSWQSQ